MNHSHYWRLEKSGEEYISKAQCQCGAIRYFADCWSSEILERVKLLNREHGKEGTMVDVGDNREGNLQSEAKSRGEPVTIPLAEVPARPDTTGMNLKGRLMAIKAYYEANKKLILEEWEAAGKPRELKRWNIGQSTLDGLLVRWGVVPKPEKHKGGRCQNCENIYIHDEQRWCSAKACPYKHRGPNRLQYRPKIEAVVKEAAETKEKPSTTGKQIIVHVYQLADGLPPFSECHSAESECEWLRCYRDLALASRANTADRLPLETAGFSEEEIKRIAEQIRKGREMLAERKAHAAAGKGEKCQEF